MEENYKCSKCNEYTVSWDLEYSRTGVSYDEKKFHVYTCGKCGSECSVLADEDYYREGDMIDME